MGASKNTLFTERQNQLATMAKAIAHPARIAILEHLIKKGTCVCGDIVDELPLSQSTISQHLKAMKDAGVIKGEIDGVYRCYCVNMEECAKLIGAFRSLFNCC